MEHTVGPNVEIPAGFAADKVQVGSVGIDYVIGGDGPTLALLHGYPQSWSSGGMSFPRWPSTIRLLPQACAVQAAAMHRRLATTRGPWPLTSTDF